MEREQRCINAFIVVITVMLGIASFRGNNDLFDYFELEESRKVLAKALGGIAFDIKQLEQEIERINESPSYAHKVLRDKYHITDEGESIYFFAD